MSRNEIDKRPWYREPMVWMMIALPAAAVIAGLSTVAIAVRASGDDAVPESVRRTAQVQVADLAAHQQAAQRQLRARLQVNQDTGALQLTMSGDAITDGRILLRFVHPIDGKHDQESPLVRSGEVWLGRTEVSLNQPWALTLLAVDDSWRLQGRLPRGQDLVELEPALNGE